VSAVVVALAAAFGAATGSFLNVVIHRLPRGESLLHPRSRCPSCDTQLRNRDNVPLLSWLLLRGRCHACGVAISARYPAVELAATALFAAIPLVRGLEPELLLWLPFAALLLAVAAIDFDHHIIPNRLLAPVAIYAVAVQAAIDPGMLPESLIAGSSAFAFLLLAALAYPGGMGMGDVKLAGVMGLFLGTSVVPALLIAFLAGSLLGIAMMAREGSVARKKGVAFGPFLALGGLVSVLAGPELIQLYTDNFLS
jgi:leader peptidase (prepilin peptidase) / N-methyltransferase